MSQLAAAVAAHGLRTRRALPDAPLLDEAFERLLVDCEQHRLHGLLGFAVGTGALATIPSQRRAVEVKLAAWSAHELRVERLLLRASELLLAARIPSRVLAGPVLAHTVYAQPELRAFDAVDLLVPGPDLARAVDVLSAGLGVTRIRPELRPGFDSRFGHEVLLDAGGHLELDLHRVLVAGAFGLTIGVDDLFAPPYRFPLAGYELEGLPMPQRLLHAAYVATLGDSPPRLVSLRDVAQLVLREQPNLVDVLLMARAWQCEAVLAEAITTAWAELALEERPKLVEWSDNFAPDRRARLLLAAHDGPARGFTRHLAAVAVLPDTADRLAYARAIALPQPEYLAARGRSLTSNARRAWQRVRG